VELKKEFGDKLTFWGGGCNTQYVLGFKDEETVRQNTRELCQIFKPGGGFVFNQVHNIMGNVPPENIVAMFDEAYKNSFYKN
jgi:uroporphyrinogen decarboxylase